jgi:hypothetical protein
VEQSFPLAVASQFFLKCPENFGWNGLQVEVHLVSNTAAGLHLVALLPLEAIREQPSFFRKRMGGGASDFRQGHSAVLPGDEVAGTGDIELGLVIASLDGAGLVDLEQLGVQRPPKELKRQFRNFGPDRKHDE